MGQVLFELPNSPEEFGVVLAPAELRNLDFSALDFQMLQRAGVEYIRTYFPTQFNDFVASNGVIMMLELTAFIGNVLSERSDILIDEAFLSTAQTMDAVIQHLALINQKVVRATPAIVNVEISLDNIAPTEIQIPGGTKFSINGSDGVVNFEIFRSPGDFISSISIPPGKRGVIAYGIEGSTNSVSVTATGDVSQFVDIQVLNVLDEPIVVNVISGDSSRMWQRVAILEESGPNDEVFEVEFLSDRARIQFGDNITGKSPLGGQIITVTYRAGGGVRGRIASGIINETRPVSPRPPASASVNAIFRNPNPSSGGTDAENITQAKKRAPQAFSTQQQAVTGEDYGILAGQYSHPVFGAVAKAIGVIRTGVDLPDGGSGATSETTSLTELANMVRAAPTTDDAVKILNNNFVNRNIVELYVLSAGPNNTLSQPNTGLKQGLISYFADISVLTDEIRVYDGAIKPVDLEITLVLSKNADPGSVKAAVNDTINSFFDLRSFDMGTGLYLSSLYNVLQSVSGVKFVDIFKPADDILATNKLGDSTVIGVGFNEVIVLGQVKLSYYFEAGTYRVPPISKV